MPFTDASFDAVTAVNSVFYAEDMTTAIGELARVVRPGGGVVVTAWGPPERCEFLTAVMPALVSLMAPPPPSAPRPGPGALSAPGALAALLEEAGLRVVEEGEVACPFVFPSTEVSWLANSSAGPAQAALGRQVDGLVLIPCDEVKSASSVRLASRATVTIQLDRFARSVKTHYVGCDNRHGRALVAGHVREITRIDPRPVVFIGARATSSSAHERLDAFTQAFPDARRELGVFSFDFGRDAAARLIDEGLKTAVFVTAADIIALGVIAAVHTRGKRVPGNYHVIGFDGIGVASLAQPPLTTVRQPVAEMTNAIVDIVRSAFENARGISGHVVRRFKPTLVISESSPR